MLIQILTKISLVLGICFFFYACDDCKPIESVNYYSHTDNDISTNNLIATDSSGLTFEYLYTDYLSIPIANSNEITLIQDICIDSVCSGLQGYFWIGIHKNFMVGEPIPLVESNNLTPGTASIWYSDRQDTLEYLNGTITVEIYNYTLTGNQNQSGDEEYLIEIGIQITTTTPYTNVLTLNGRYLLNRAGYYNKVYCE